MNVEPSSFIMRVCTEFLSSPFSSLQKYAADICSSSFSLINTGKFGLYEGECACVILCSFLFGCHLYLELYVLVPRPSPPRQCCRGVMTQQLGFHHGGSLLIEEKCGVFSCNSTALRGETARQYFIQDDQPDFLLLRPRRGQLSLRWVFDVSVSRPTKGTVLMLASYMLISSGWCFYFYITFFASHALADALWGSSCRLWLKRIHSYVIIKNKITVSLRYIT